ncbi:hypothetical protein IKI_05799 [Bacillus toyonensis]|uniref:retron St85 family RNA-directed DNA polymerase n=1 Tax=Bacillus toyonensis TaxID=155322 RepID=UPI00033076BB|nr:retron St85 family RNA-directed DNA polymerase [Bacillus toyonensis]EOP35269.1 hypothetical protein IKI_05799 [Bacillus toyonensis]MCA1048138.1 retron St85 family RNA-directed DNA polymerase [Bacillus toyonensis]HDR7425733.1 retron St85 family RNA-directed DNA polymerase [Bacillus toyonensis]
MDNNNNIASYFLGIPTINNQKDLANHLNLSEYTLYKIINYSDKYYKEINIPKKNEGIRKLACPSKNLKAIQAWILRNILDPLSTNPSATAFKKETNITSNVERHLDNQFFLCLDINNFFGSIPQKNINNFFKTLGYNKHVSLMLTKICTYKGFLPQGGVTSPALSNLINIKLDKRISGYCSKRNIVYSRYADDFTFSSNNPNKLIQSIKTIQKIINDENYELNNKKTRIIRPGNSKKITGLIITDNKKISIGRKQKRILRATMYTLYNNDALTQKEKIEMENHINGWIAYLKGIDYNSHKQLLKWKKKFSHERDQKVMKELLKQFQMEL